MSNWFFGGGLLAFVFPFALLGLGLLYGWVIFTFIQYRRGRQNEVRLLLAVAAETQTPLDVALGAYRLDRPDDQLRHIWVAVLLFPLLPGYYWAWYRQKNFNRKVERVVGLLQGGVPLHVALRAAPGVATRETILAASVGHASGRLGPCLRLASPDQVRSLWLDTLPRFLYPLVLLFAFIALLIFHTQFISPKFEKILADFRLKPPPAMEFAGDIGRVLVYRAWIPLLGLLALFGTVAILFFSPTVRWYVPGIGRLSRMQVQGRLLRMLATLLEAGQTVPAALTTLIDSRYSDGTPARRLARAWSRVVHGEPLADALYQAGLLPRAMQPLVESAGRAGNLPWALAELGDSRLRRSERIAQRVSQALFPLSVLAVGVLAAVFAVGVFSPILTVLAGLSQ